MNKLFLLLAILFSISETTLAQKEITLEDIWENGTFSASYVPGFRFMKDGKHYTRTVDDEIQSFNIISGDQVETLFSAPKFKDQSDFNGKIANYSFDISENYILVETDVQSIYRRSTKANYYLYNRTTSDFKSIFSEGKISYATVSPNGKSIAYMYDNNVYIQGIDGENKQQITKDGKYNHIINGGADWVYEEEFAFAKAFFWNADGSKLAYMKFDETAVKEFTMTYHNNDMYPEYTSFKYPKVGETNAIVSVHVYDLASGNTTDMALAKDAEMYIPRIKWTLDPDELFVFHMNRHQNELVLYNMDANSGKMEQVLLEKSKYYIDIDDDLTFLDNGKEFIWTSEKSGYKHIYLHSINGKKEKALTSGDYDVSTFYGYDEARKQIYFQASMLNPMEKEVYSLGLSSKKPTKISKDSGSNRCQFSSTYDYYVLTNSSINKAASYVVNENKGSQVRSLESNENIESLQSIYGTSPIEFFSFNTSENVLLNGWMMKPANFQANRKYPVLMYVYGGPGSQTVTDGWKGNNYWWFQMLAQKGYIVVSVDNRGTGSRGEEFKKMTYLQLGKYETIDQIEAAKYLGGLDYIDQERIGIFGWSFGGYMSSLCILKGNDVFKAAIAVAPVTNWKWYDSIYTERYMRTHSENEEGYEENSPVNFADQLKGSYLLVHGMTDDNVHFQHTAEMANALIKANKPFDTHFYPNRNHGIYGNSARIHLYSKMTRFLLNNL